MVQIVRVATTQYRTGNDVDQNLHRLLSLIAEAAAGGAQLVVTPEFGNHTSFYADKDQAWDIAITLDGPYLGAVQACAAQHGIHVVFNCTRRGAQKPLAYITNFLLGPDGALIGYDDKQILMGGEAAFLEGAQTPGRVYDTAIGRIGMMSCLDGVTPETARNLALRGAQIITNGHNSCALDEPYAHIPVRAAENHCWVVAAGKVGAVCTDDMLQPLAEMIDLPAHLITALGENPILDPSGHAVARLPCAKEGLAFADIDVRQADDKGWRDGDLIADRRPELYGPVAKAEVLSADIDSTSFIAGVLQLRSDRPVELNIERALDLLADAADNGARLVVLPELVIHPANAIAQDPALALRHSQQLLSALSTQCRASGVFAVVSAVTEDDGLRHSGLLIDDQGEQRGCYHQTHLRRSDRAWARPGDALPVWDTPLGRIGILLGYDMLFPEAATVLARQGAELIAHPTRWEFSWEPDLVLPERASENRVSILSAARLDSALDRGSMICALPKSRALRARDLNPIWPQEAARGREQHLCAPIDPARSRNKDLIGFDLLRDRRPELYEQLLSTAG